MKKLAVLTSGGGAPGMNACLRAIVQMGEEKGFSVYGIIGGFQGLIDGVCRNLTHQDVENIISNGGTILKTSRCGDFLTETGFKKAVDFIKSQNFEAVIILGGDGSLNGAVRLKASGVNVIGIPCTIDNDISYTDFTIGFDTAVNTVTSLLNNIRETCSSHNRVCVVEVMGRHSGEIALNAGVASGAEVIIAPEVKTDFSLVCDKIIKSISLGEKCVLVVVAEGCGSARIVANDIKTVIKIDAKAVELGYTQRGGSPSVFDRLLAIKMGAKAVELAFSKKYGVALSINKNVIKASKLETILKNGNHKFDHQLYDVNNIISK